MVRLLWGLATGRGGKLSDLSRIDKALGQTLPSDAMMHQKLP